MRIAVCSAQVPFARGGTEIFVDDLVAELRKREHEAELVTVPYKWYPGTRVLTQAFLWRLSTSTEADGTADRPRDRDEVPVVCGAPSEQGRLAPAPVPPGLRARPDGARPVLRVARRTGPRGGPCTRSTSACSARRRKLFTTSRNNQQRLESSIGLVAEVLPHPPQELPYRCEDYGDFVLSVGRLDRAKRVDLLHRGARPTSSSRSSSPGTGPTADGSRGWRASAASTAASRFLGRVDDERARALCTHAASPSSTRRWTRTSGWFRTRRSSRTSPS